MDIVKLKELKNEITEKRDRLQESLIGSTGVDSRYVRDLLLQCNAELRVIEYIENGFEGTFHIC